VGHRAVWMRSVYRGVQSGVSPRSFLAVDDDDGTSRDVLHPATSDELTIEGPPSQPWLIDLGHDFRPVLVAVVTHLWNVYGNDDEIGLHVCTVSHRSATQQTL
jgi:hypothetical protein